MMHLMIKVQLVILLKITDAPDQDADDRSGDIDEDRGTPLGRVKSMDKGCLEVVIRLIQMTGQGSPVRRGKIVTMTGYSLDTANPGRDPRRVPQNIVKEREGPKGAARQTASKMHLNSLSLMKCWIRL